jgi:hypothetical protein
MREGFAANFGDKKLAVASRQLTVSQFLFHQGILTKNNMTITPTHPTSLFPRLKKLKSGNIDIVEMIKVESQAVLNILTGQDFQDAFKT